MLVRAASMSVEFFDLVMSLYADRGADEAANVARNLLYDLAYSLGRADARAFAEDPEVMLELVALLERLGLQNAG